MNLKEYEGRALFKKYGIPVPRGFLLSGDETARGTAERARGTDAGKVVARTRVAKKLEEFLKTAPGLERFALKAQLMTGKRGKSGGIVFADLKDFGEKVRELSLKVINGEKVGEILAAEALEIKGTYFISVALDRFERCPVLMLSTEGGIDIEETAAADPSKIRKIFLRDEGDIPEGGELPEAKVREAIADFGLDKKTEGEFIKIARELLKLFTAEDCLLAEINPLILTKENHLIAADAKIVIDDNSIFRHPQDAAILSRSFSVLEDEAHRSGLAYVELDGNLAIIGNGAGLVMATLDAVKDFGGRPANFCDAGGGAGAEMIREAVEIVLRKNSVKALFINVFGGITRCDLVAEGITEYFKGMKKRPPMVVRMTGTNEEQGRQILEETGISAFTDFEEAAKAAAALK